MEYSPVETSLPPYLIRRVSKEAEAEEVGWALKGVVDWYVLSKIARDLKLSRNGM